MKKIGFVTPWFGMDIPGGAEAELRGLVQHLSAVGQDVEVLTTCVKSFNSDWSENHHKPGLSSENGVSVRRFKVRKRDTIKFNTVNYKLMTGKMPLTDQEERIFIEEMVNSSDLYQYLEEKNEEYSVYVFIPYMFGTTYFGIRTAPYKAVLIPCFHDESYIYLNIYKELFPQVAGMVFNAEPEAELAEQVYNLASVKKIVPGIGMDTDITGDAETFRRKYKLYKPFILYAGRKDKGKNVNTLLQYYAEYVRRNKTELQMVLIGGGKINIPSSIKERVHDLGFVDIQDKYNAYAAAEMLCQPSKNESFSLVIMESWLCGRPVLVNSDCPVTKNFVHESNGGLYFKDFFEFEQCVNFLTEHKDISATLGQQGREYVLGNFSWDIIIEKYLNFFEEVVKENDIK